jgi:hypothetical protein
MGEKEQEEDAEETWLQLRPVEPLPSQCCGSGCSPCVFDLYHQDLARWEAARARKDGSLLSRKQPQVRKALFRPEAQHGGDYLALLPPSTPALGSLF